MGIDYVGPGSKPDLTDEEAKAFTEVVKEVLSRRSCGLTLDFGCGSGRMTRVISKYARPYLGVDISPTGIDQAKWAHPRNHFLWLHQDHIPLPDKRVKTMVALIVFQHIVSDEDWEVWAKEIRRVLAPGGSLLVIDDKGGPEMQEHMRPRTPEEIGDALEMVRFRKVGKLKNHWAGVFR